MSDRPDDLQIGVRSTAILFGSYDRVMVAILQAAATFLLLAVALREQLSVYFYVVLAVAVLTFIYQQWLIRDRNRDACFAAFKNNAWFGFGVWFAILLGQ